MIPVAGLNHSHWVVRRNRVNVEAKETGGGLYILRCLSNRCVIGLYDDTLSQTDICSVASYFGEYPLYDFFLKENCHSFDHTIPRASIES